jgi:predicted amidohydrolase
MGDRFEDFTLAAVQAAPVYLDREASIDKAVGLIADAGAKGSDLAVFGETWVSGYASFAAWPSHPAFRGLLSQFVANAVEVPSSATDALCAAARKAGTDVVIGVAERDGTTGGSVYCTLLFISREGQLLGKHRKLKPTLWERTVWGEGDGSTLRLYDRRYGRLGGLNCWEHQMVLPGYALMSQGLQVHAAAWPGGAFTRQEILCRAFAMQSAAYVVMAGGLLRDEDLPPGLRELSLEIDGRRRDIILRCDGLSGIIAPNGDMLAGPTSNEETILTAPANTGQVMLQKMIADHAGH